MQKLSHLNLQLHFLLRWAADNGKDNRLRIGSTTRETLGPFTFRRLGRRDGADICWQLIEANNNNNNYDNNNNQSLSQDTLWSHFHGQCVKVRLNQRRRPLGCSPVMFHVLLVRSCQIVSFSFNNTEITLTCFIEKLTASEYDSLLCISMSCD